MTPDSRELVHPSAGAGRKPLVMYHAGCADGTGAALAAYYLFGDDAEYRPVAHSDPRPSDDEVVGRVVCIFDFSYPREVIERFQRVALHLEQLAEQRPIGIAWGWDGRRKQYIVSLRSNGEVGVSEIAKLHGGGGHRRAVAFSCVRLPWRANEQRD